jgi:hypothetical protein
MEKRKAEVAGLCRVAESPGQQVSVTEVRQALVDRVPAEVLEVGTQEPATSSTIHSLERSWISRIWSMTATSACPCGAVDERGERVVSMDLHLFGRAQADRNVRIS